jgi:hypothetical protein
LRSCRQMLSPTSARGSAGEQTSHAGSSETGAGMFTSMKLRGQLVAAEGNPRNASPGCSTLASTLVIFDFELLPLVMTQRRMDGQPAEDWSHHV